jgi:hypothetical protein
VQTLGSNDLGPEPVDRGDCSGCVVFWHACKLGLEGTLELAILSEQKAAKIISLL